MQAERYRAETKRVGLGLRHVGPKSDSNAERDCARFMAELGRHEVSNDNQRSFEQLSRRYHVLRDEIGRSEGRRTQADLGQVTEACLDVERGMGGYRERHRYAREGMTPDRD
jgi:hypothetical protein